MTAFLLYGIITYVILTVASWDRAVTNDSSLLGTIVSIGLVIVLLAPLLIGSMLRCSRIPLIVFGLVSLGAALDFNVLDLIASAYIFLAYGHALKLASQPSAPISGLRVS
jgi:hypothetical protein